MRIPSQRIAQAGALLVLVSVALLLIGNRWANYIVTPINGLYLVDVLFAAGSLLGLARLSVLRFAPGWALWLFLIVWSYSLVVVIPELFMVPVSDRYNALRDAAPFLYLSLAPLASLALTSVGSRILISVMRWAGSGAALVTLSTFVGLTKPFSTWILGSEFAQIFAYRPDLVGAAVGIGIIAWGSWPSCGRRGSLLAQGALLLVGVSMLENRSGLMALLVCGLIAVVREVHTSRNVVVPIGAFALVMGGVAVQTIGLPVNEVNPPSLTQSAPTTAPAYTSPGVKAPEPGAFDRWFQENIIKVGTTNARLLTWTDIVTGMTRDSSWLMGGAAGSDYMYELCTGIPVAPTSVLNGPMCAVDDTGPEPVVRDPHNWILNIVLYHGLIGLAVFSAALAVPAFRQRRSAGAMMPIGGILAYLTSGMTFLISSGYALIPISFFVSWLLRNAVITHDQLAPSSPSDQAGSNA